MKLSSNSLRGPDYGFLASSVRYETDRESPSPTEAFSASYLRHFVWCSSVSLPWLPAVKRGTSKVGVKLAEMLSYSREQPRCQLSNRIHKTTRSGRWNDGFWFGDTQGGVSKPLGGDDIHWWWLTDDGICCQIYSLFKSKPVLLFGQQNHRHPREHKNHKKWVI